ncbi:hypothetical protein BA190_09545 [Labrys sp. WJW]|uniref:hypothetical protein n=1 Tax=Labrys sp. WJW TaxID=1737983 RepID=UPI000830727F|nr:hypothetical protein [Labrys sp. WJW]OCC05148.1 hypothetical protein BA190_09545 [Labrys sp. WJW]
MRRIIMRLSDIAGTVAFRNNVGMGWVGDVVHRDYTRDTLLLRHPRPIRFGLCEGSADIIGWHSVVVTPDMVGKRVAIFMAPEVKTPDGKPPTKLQRNFIRAVNDAGGISFPVRSEDEAAEALRRGRP